MYLEVDQWFPKNNAKQFTILIELNKQVLKGDHSLDRVVMITDSKWLLKVKA